MSKMKFSTFERALLKLAGKEAQKVAKAAKSASAKAHLTEAESEAHAMIGYAEEAALFLDQVDGPSKNEVTLSFGHRTALRTGCLIMIANVEDIASDQTEALVDPDAITGTEERAADFRRLEGRLRTMDEEQPDLPLDADKPDSPDDGGDDSANTETEDEGPFVGEGPFDAEGVSERLALPAAPVDLTQHPHGEIVDAEFEVLDDDNNDDPRGHRFDDTAAIDEDDSAAPTPEDE